MRLRDDMPLTLREYAAYVIRDHQSLGSEVREALEESIVKVLEHQRERNAQLCEYYNYIHPWFEDVAQKIREKSSRKKSALKAEEKLGEAIKITLTKKMSGLYQFVKVPNNRIKMLFRGRSFFVELIFPVPMGKRSYVRTKASGETEIILSENFVNLEAPGDLKAKPRFDLEESKKITKAFTV